MQKITKQWLGAYVICENEFKYIQRGLGLTPLAARQGVDLLKGSKIRQAPEWDRKVVIE